MQMNDSKSCIVENHGNWRKNSCNDRNPFVCKISTNRPPGGKHQQYDDYVCPQFGNEDINEWKWNDLYTRSAYCYWFNDDQKLLRF